MWIQQRIRNHDLELYKVLGEENPADIFTKSSIPQDRMEKLLEYLGCRFEGGRAESAPKLRREGGMKTFMVTSSRGGLTPPLACNNNSCNSGAKQVSYYKCTRRRARSPMARAGAESYPEGNCVSSWDAEFEEGHGLELSIEELQENASRFGLRRDEDWAEVAAGHRVVPPPAPLEADEPEDALLKHGAELGALGRGRGELPHRSPATVRRGAEEAPGLSQLLATAVSSPCEKEQLTREG